MLRAILLKVRLKLRHVLKMIKQPIRPLDTDWFYLTHWENTGSKRTIFTPERNIHFFFNPGNHKQYAALLKKQFPDQNAQTVTRADKIIDGTVAVLGIESLPVNPPVNWQNDFRSGYTWDLISSRKLQIVDPSNNADIKVPWELSRLQFVTDLGRAYWLTSDKKYLNRFTELITDWHEQNPVETGVNWTCAMEVSIRAINMIWGLYLFSINNALSDQFVQETVKSLYYHALYIEKNLEIIADHANTNHLLTDYLGLFYIGMLFPEFDRAERWKQVGLDGLEKEIRLETFDDGADYECSFAYHRLVFEIFLHAYILGQKNNIRFSDDYESRLKNMARFSHHISAPSGKTTLAGDNDNGFIVKLNETDPARHTYLVELAAIALNQTVPSNISISEERLWFHGPDSFIHPTEIISPKSVLFANSGHAVHANDNYHVLFNCGNIAKKSLGGHKHNDLLSVTLELNKEPILIDPGTYCYTSDFDLRNRNRSTMSHNTVTIDQSEQNPLIDNRLFYMPNQADPKIDLWIVTDDLAVVSGNHTGYNRLNDKITHTRTVWSFLKQQTMLLQDDFTGKIDHKHELVTTFITPQTDISLIDDNTIRIKGLTQPLFLQFASNKQGELIVEPFDYYPHYGVKKEGRVIRYRQRVRVNHTNVIALAPVRNATRLVEQLTKTMSRLDLKQSANRQVINEFTYV